MPLENLHFSPLLTPNMATNSTTNNTCVLLLYSFVIQFFQLLAVSHSQSPISTHVPLNFADQRLARDYPIIQAFKRSITSDPFNYTQTWVGADICSYKGFYCDNPPDNLSAIALAGIDFNGFELAAPTVEGFVDQLIDLAVFHVNTNFFSGTISPNISKLPYLYELDLSNNNFSGDFPSSVLGASGLFFLDIRFNSFSGSVPPQVFTLALGVLFLNNNNFRQKIPDNLGSSPAIYLTLANNRFTGPIPKSILNTSSTLREILLLNNLLSGCLPYEIGLMKQLQLFDAGNNLLTGPLPWSLGCLSSLETLNLAGNFFYGQVPEMICSLGNLNNLSLSDNYFTKVGPICRKLVRIGVVDLRQNCIHDLPEQRPLHECVEFFLNPRYCPYPSSFNLIPCGHTLGGQKRQVGPNKRGSVTYRTLFKHN